MWHLVLVSKLGWMSRVPGNITVRSGRRADNQRDVTVVTSVPALGMALVL
jgi:hypothetical protein